MPKCHTYLTDSVYGGLYEANWIDKGDPWKANYPESLCFAEALQLTEQYLERIDELNASFEPAPSM